MKKKKQLNKLINNIKNKIASNKNHKTKYEKMNEIVNDIKKGVVPNKDYLIMLEELKKRNLENLNTVGTVMCHKCGKVTHIFDYEKGELLGKCLDWYTGDLYWYCKDCSTNGKDEFIKIN